MNIRQKFKPWKPVKLRLRTKLLILFSVCLLLCGFVWNWTIEFAMAVLFPIDEAIDFEMIQNFPNLVNTDDYVFYLTDQTEAEQIVDKVRTNFSTNVYSGIELPDMTQESLGKKIIRTILDRIFS